VENPRVVDRADFQLGFAAAWRRRSSRGHLGQSYVLEAGALRRHARRWSPRLAKWRSWKIAQIWRFSTLPIAIQKRKTWTNLRVIGRTKFQDGVPGYYSQEYMVLSDGARSRKSKTSRARSWRSTRGGSAVDVCDPHHAAAGTVSKKKKRDLRHDGGAAFRPWRGPWLAEKKEADLIPVVARRFAFRPGAAGASRRPLFVNSDIHGA